MWTVMSKTRIPTLSSNSYVMILTNELFPFVTNSEELENGKTDFKM